MSRTSSSSERRHLAKEGDSDTSKIPPHDTQTPSPYRNHPHSIYPNAHLPLPSYPPPPPHPYGLSNYDSKSFQPLLNGPHPYPPPPPVAYNPTGFYPPNQTLAPPHQPYLHANAQHPHQSAPRVETTNPEHSLPIPYHHPTAAPSPYALPTPLPPQPTPPLTYPFPPPYYPHPYNSSTQPPQPVYICEYEGCKKIFTNALDLHCHRERVRTGLEDYMKSKGFEKVMKDACGKKFWERGSKFSWEHQEKVKMALSSLTEKERYLH